MTLVLQDNRHSPTRLLWLFIRSAAVALVFASAACAALYVVRDISATHDSPPSSAPISLPGGLELLTPLADAAEFQRIVGFPPVIPEALPDGTASIP